MIRCFLQHPYEDPEGRIDLPASMRSQVDHWKRPVEFIYEKVQFVLGAAAFLQNRCIVFAYRRVPIVATPITFGISSLCG